MAEIDAASDPPWTGGEDVMDGTLVTNVNPAPRPGGLRVLIVEDSPLLTARLVELLETLPTVQAVTTCDNEAAARHAVLAADVVILDLHLKQGSGFGVLKRMLQREERPVVFVCTNHDIPGYRRRAFDLGADYFLDKSRDLPELPLMLQRLARGERVAKGRFVHRPSAEEPATGLA
jgi:DNA-binding NarL/FixJ family response regulator